MTSSRAARGWSSLLTGEWGDRALDAVRDISVALVNPPPSDLLADKTEQQRQAEEATLARGRSGLAILFAYLARAEPHLPPWGDAPAGDERRAHHLAVAVAHLDVAVEAIGSVDMPPSLHTGFCGVAYAAAVVHELSGADASADPNEDLDEVLRAYVRRTPWLEDYDLISGLAGLGAYALTRLPRPSAREIVASVVHRLRESATETDEGVAWFTAPQAMPSGTREDYAQGHFNLGVGHGLPGVLAFLAGALGAGVEADVCEPLVQGATRWLLSRELEPDMLSRFPYVVGPGVAPAASRAAWCYGDPGIAAALVYAASATGSLELASHALRIARAAAARAPENAGAIDACLCHGSAGLGHLFNRIHQATGDEPLGETARTWYRRAIESRTDGEGIAGFRTWKGAVKSGGSWIVHPGLLDGAAGIALCLLGAVTPVEPRWDHALLVAAPPGGISGLTRPVPKS